jgi:acetyl-CoA carboxylase carboxyltransferase component
VARRRKTGQRTARENIADLCDDGSFVEYGALAIAAQRRRRLARRPDRAQHPGRRPDRGIGTVNGDRCSPRAGPLHGRSYDYTVLAGTQGFMNHKKIDRMLALAEQWRLPLVLFAEGGGGRPGDTDVGRRRRPRRATTFGSFARAVGPRAAVGIVSGAALPAMPRARLLRRDHRHRRTPTIGMGGPAMIEGGGLGVFRPEEVGPIDVQVPNGVVDILVADEAEAVAAAQAVPRYFQGRVDDWTCADQRPCAV